MKEYILYKKDNLLVYKRTGDFVVWLREEHLNENSTYYSLYHCNILLSHYDNESDAQDGFNKFIDKHFWECYTTELCR